jgi:hypothetical protein
MISEHSQNIFPHDALTGTKNVNWHSKLAVANVPDTQYVCLDSNHQCCPKCVRHFCALHACFSRVLRPFACTMLPSSNQVPCCTCVELILAVLISHHHVHLHAPATTTSYPSPTPWSYTLQLVLEQFRHLKEVRACSFWAWDNALSPCSTSGDLQRQKHLG